MLTVGLVLLAIFAPILLGADANRIDVAAMQQGMSARHWLGTDALGRDVLDRVLVATRLSLELATLATVLGSVGGILLGALPSVLGRRFGRLVTGLINLLVAFPGLLLALFLAVVFGVGATGAVFALAAASAPGFARLSHMLASSVAGSDYVAAARQLGVRRSRLLARHILPNIAEPLIINATTALGGTLLAFAGLSFIGFGVQPPEYDWGQMLNDGLTRIYIDPAAALAPGVAVVLAGIAFNLLGEAGAQAAGAGRATRGLRPVEVPRPGPKAAAARAGEGAGEGAAVGAGEGVAVGTVDALMPVLRIRGLTVTFPSPDGPVSPVLDLTLDVAAGEIVGVVGESGSGKSLTAAAVAQLVPYPGTVVAESIELNGCELRDLSEARRRALLGANLALVFQDPMSALNPALRVGRQLAEVVEVHAGATRRAALERAVERLRDVRIPSPERRARQYPVQFSGGMRQRAVIAQGLMADPVLILADEPTTALDVTVQRQILALLRQARDERGTAVLLISHDIAVVAEAASRVLVMYAGRIVEDLPTADLAVGAAHPYTRALIGAVPDMGVDRHAPLATIEGRPPAAGALPPGCAFAARCPLADDRCRSEVPELLDLAGGRRLACWHPQVGLAESAELAAESVESVGSVGSVETIEAVEVSG